MDCRRLNLQKPKHCPFLVKLFTLPNIYNRPAGHLKALESVKPYCPEQNIPQSVKRDCMKIEQLK